LRTLALFAKLTLGEERSVESAAQKNIKEAALQRRGRGRRCFRMERGFNKMTRNIRGIRYAAAGLVTLAAAWSGLATAQESCTCVPATTTRYRVAYDEEEVTRYRLVYQTEMREQTVTRLRPVVETEMRERRYRVARPVTETSEREVRVKVLRPVTTTEMRDRSFDRTTWVEETEERERVHEVLRPVVETTVRRENYVVRRAVDETQYQDRSYVVTEPVTTMRPQTYDVGGYTNQLAYQPGQVRNRLTWLNSGYQIDPATGAAYYQRPGLHWVPTQKPGSYQMQRVYVPNYVTGYVPETTYVNRVVNEQVPVQVRRYVDELETREIPQQTVRYERQQVVEKIPVKVRRPVIERVERQEPVQVTRWQEVEEVRRIPITQTRVEYEERVEQIPVTVTRYERVEEVVQQPVRVGRWTPYTTIVRRPRLVPVEEYSPYVEEAVIDYAPPAASTSASRGTSGKAADQAPSLKQSDAPAPESRQKAPTPAPKAEENKDNELPANNEEEAKDLTEEEAKNKGATGGLNQPSNGNPPKEGTGAGVPGSLGKYTSKSLRPAPATRLASNPSSK
jgi:hypothetical protein